MYCLVCVCAVCLLGLVVVAVGVCDCVVIHVCSVCFFAWLLFIVCDCVCVVGCLFVRLSAPALCASVW